MLSEIKPKLGDVPGHACDVLVRLNLWVEANLITSWHKVLVRDVNIVLSEVQHCVIRGPTLCYQKFSIVLPGVQHSVIRGSTFCYQGFNILLSEVRPCL